FLKTHAKVIKKAYFISFAFMYSLVSQSQEKYLDTDSVWAERPDKMEYRIHSRLKAPVSIYWQDSEQKKQSKVIYPGDSITVPVPLSKRFLFSYSNPFTREAIMFSERRLWFEQSPNFRDLGGLISTTGKRVKWGVIFRCGDMGTLSESDLVLIKNLRVKTVVDLRNEQEIKTSPDKYPTDVSVKRVWSSISPEQSQGMSAFYKLIMNPNATSKQVDSLFTTFYAQMPLNARAYKPLFEELTALKNDSSLLFHCTAGKDRTGLGSALILYALGIPEDIIIQEYFLSNRYTKDILAKSPMMAKLPVEVATVLAGVQPHYIQASLAAIKNQYGSVKNFFKQELGFRESDFLALQDKFLY
ncbi:MAG: hypothetical protein RL152_654, partial [Bacteroidota bacterium]